MSNSKSSEDGKAIWDALEKRICQLVDEVTLENLETTVAELSKLDIVRGKGLFSKACMDRPNKNMYDINLNAILVAAVNAKFPEVGYLHCKRVIWFFNTVLRKNLKRLLISNAKYIACLVNSAVLDGNTVVNMLMNMVKNPIEGSFEATVHLLEECEWCFESCSAQPVKCVYDHLAKALLDEDVEEDEKSGIKDFLARRIIEVRRINLAELFGIVGVGEQVTHSIGMGSEPIDTEYELNDFEAHPSFREAGLECTLCGEDSMNLG